MPELVPLNGTRVIRDGKRVRPVIGKPFEYTDDEVVQLKAGGAKFEKPTGTAPVAPVAASDTKSNAEASQAGAKGGRKKATAAKAESDEDKGDAAGDEDDDL